MSRTSKVLVLVLSVLLVVCGVCVGAGTWLWNSLALDTTGTVGFTHALPVPPLAPSHLDASGRRVFDLRAQAGRHDFGGRTAPTWGFNGDYLGPTLRANRGEQVIVNVHNGLQESTTVHWHGMHLPAIMDGGPHQPVAPDGDWSPTWTIDQPAATLWYHPHPHGQTARHVYRGLAGMFLLDDPSTPVLPHSYGVDDFPVIVQDKKFDGDQLDFSDGGLGGSGLLGDTIVVNGATGPYLDVTSQQVRLRLLNASNARIYDFGFADDRNFDLIGSDGGLLASPYRTNRVQLSPGERAEIVVSMRAGERVVLRSTPPRASLGILGRFNGGADTLDILELRAAPRLTSSPRIPAKLADVPRLEPDAHAPTRSFRLSDRQINGEQMDMSRIDETVTRDTTELWRVTNEDGVPHNFHIHGTQFQVRRVDAAAPPRELSGWKDTVYLAPQVHYELVVPFGHYSDPDHPYMYHCHLLLHEDQGMMGQFVVVAPGQSSGAPQRLRHG